MHNRVALEMIAVMSVQSGPASATGSRSFAEQRGHGRRVLAEVAARFEDIGSGGLEPPELVCMISALERELRWVLDELDRLDEEALTRS